MSTSDPSGGPALPPGALSFSPEDFATEIARVANEMFGGGPVVPAASVPAPAVPPNPGPSALATGAGGVSSAQTLPPVPGALHTPPLAASPAPRAAET